ncbi:hypothetical protein [Janthinobacterium sp. MP5059B]|uniref:hypothetical protein n=1 Tax=Janthinobacterium sp. MP5059B TaxID=1766683 RepID=UPI0011131E0A|nr:hypothetical protein [Janthinobacterium sp. MP5059B]
MNQSELFAAGIAQLPGQAMTKTAYEVVRSSSSSSARFIGKVDISLLELQSPISLTLYNVTSLLNKGDCVAQDTNAFRKVLAETIGIRISGICSFQYFDARIDNTLTQRDFVRAVIWKRNKPAQLIRSEIDAAIKSIANNENCLNYIVLNSGMLIKKISQVRQGFKNPFCKRLCMQQIHVDVESSQFSLGKSFCSSVPGLVCCKPNSSQEGGDRTNRSNPICPYRNVHLAPWNSFVASQTYGSGYDHDCPFVVPSHPASEFSWRNGNTQSIGGGK